MNLELCLLEKEDLPQYNADMQEAFQLGAQEGGCLADGELVLPEAEIDSSLHAKGARRLQGDGGRPDGRRSHRRTGAGGLLRRRWSRHVCLP